MWKRLFGSVVLILVPFIAKADFLKGTEYANKGNVEQAIKEFRAGAEKGEAQSQWSLASYYYYGEGMEQDDKKAFELFEKAAANGSAEAHYFLSVMYREGRFVAVNPDLEFTHTRAAAEGCISLALNDYSVYFYDGNRVPQDFKMAAALLLVAYWIDDDKSFEDFNFVMRKVPVSSAAEVKQMHHEIIAKYKCQTHRPDFD